MALMAETATEETSTKKGRGVTLWPHSGGGRDDDDLYIIGAVCVSVSKSHYLLGKLFWQVNFFS